MENSKKVNQKGEQNKERTNSKKILRDTELFGSIKNKDFSISHLRSLVEKKEFQNAKKYLRCYFAPSRKEASYFHYIPTDNQIITIKKTDKGVNNINHYPGMLHENYLPYDQYDEEIKAGVKMMWDHILEVWCSEDTNTFQYVQNWICQMVSGTKMTTLLYLQGSQGTGKSLPCEFLQKMVLGTNIVHTTSKTQCITGNFNYELHRKLLVILEEVPAASTSEWRNLSDGLKNYVTGQFITIEGKFMHPVQYKNPLSFILLTNHFFFIFILLHFTRC
jgi:phage/plasmid-associated DNA primase